ncbi:MAG: hypothetical protein H0V78_10550 [Burkholderiales bacterium]|nr:hypothetical protein [Burkholderiales bacterium]
MVFLGKSYPLRNVPGCDCCYKRLKTHAPQYVDTVERPALRPRPVQWQTLGKQVGKVESDSGQDACGIASSKTVKQNSTVVEFADDQGWTAIVMLRASGDPLARPRVSDAFKPG